MLIFRLAVSAGLLSASLFAQNDWPEYGHDPGAMRYSPLKQINTKNVGQLKVAWTFDTQAPITPAPPAQSVAGDAGGH
ncbi:MAG TPA: pyrroloquinoline quinone-dependent dehydrogenase, partial [Bryobacteraceae bacterium]|nr:pyrroloquinoline quinone-dependent dehydrogenase [Bryobacteraceae bacterium]